MGIGRGWLWFFGVLFSVFATGIAASFSALSEGQRLALLVWQQLLFAVAGICGSRREYLASPGRKGYLRALAAGVGIFVLNTILGALVLAAAAALAGSGPAQELLLRDRAGVEMLVTSKKPFVAGGAVLLVLVGAPLGEELFFRGLLVSLLRERLKAKWAVTLAALLFALLHFYTLQFLPVLVSGILLGLLFIRSGSILVPITAHFTVNALALLALLSAL